MDHSMSILIQEKIKTGKKNLQTVFDRNTQTYDTSNKTATQKKSPFDYKRRNECTKNEKNEKKV